MCIEQFLMYIFKNEYKLYSYKRPIVSIGSILIFPDGY